MPVKVSPKLVKPLWRLPGTNIHKKLRRKRLIREVVTDLDFFYQLQALAISCQSHTHIKIDLALY